MAAQRMSLSKATVKMLLRDAKFYTDPASDPARGGAKQVPGRPGTDQAEVNRGVEGRGRGGAVGCIGQRLNRSLGQVHHKAPTKRTAITGHRPTRHDGADSGIECVQMTRVGRPGVPRKDRHPHIDRAVVRPYQLGSFGTTVCRPKGVMKALFGDLLQDLRDAGVELLP